MTVNQSGRCFLAVILACAALCAAAPGSRAASDYYVTPGGAGDYGGTNWHNAYSNVQAAATLATNAGDKIFLQWGVYSNAVQIVISNAAGLTVYGGCNGLSGGSSNDYSGTNSTLTKTGGVMRIVAGYNATATLAYVTVQGGNFNTGTNNGAGLFFTNCAVMLTNCVVRDNTNLNNSTVSGGSGGGLYCSGGSLEVSDCVFSNNYLKQTTAQAAGGGALAGSNTPMRIVRTLFVTNKLDNFVGASFFGGALYSSGAPVVITNCDFRGNYVYNANGASYGGAVCVMGNSVVVYDSSFASNWCGSAGGSGVGQGGAVYLANLQTVTVRSNYFVDNFIFNTAIKYGGALLVANCATTVVDACLIESGSQIAYAEHVYIIGGTNAFILNTTVRGNNSQRGLAFAGAVVSSLVMTNCRVLNNGGDGIWLTGGCARVTNCQVGQNGGDGIRVTGGTATVAHCTFTNNAGCGANCSSAGALGLTNCLLAQNGGDGILMAAGAAAVVNCTLADNGGWGMNWSGGTGTVINSIAWGNLTGGVASNGNLGVTYSCSQNPPAGAGTGNMITNPLFAPVPGYYYLSETNLAEQTNHSPCIDAGFGLASDYGLEARTTRTDGTNDSGVVDMGYHYPNGVPVPHLIPVCYVDAVNGSNAWDGLSWTSAWKSVTYAMTNVAANGTIHLAAGVYSAAATAESFPLAAQMANLTLAASNTNPALTALDNAGANGQRVFQAWSKGSILLKGLTIRGGYFASGENNGAGLYFRSCAVTLTNCVVRDNVNTNTSSIFNGYGGGMYCSGGSLEVIDCVFSNNHLEQTTALGTGGGALAGSNTPMRIVRTLFVTNKLDNFVGASFFGGAIYSAGAPVVITNCDFRGNYAYNANGWSYGGAVYVSGSSAVVCDSSFSSNWCGSAGGSGVGQGGALYLANLSSASLISNYFLDNSIFNSANRYGSALNICNCTTAIVDRGFIESRFRNETAEHVYISGVTNAVILQTTLRGTISSRGIVFTGAGSRLTITNCLVLNNARDGLLILTGAVTVVNCTLADNVGWGIARPTTAALTVKNSILWGNTLGGIGHNQNLTLTYTDSQDAWSAGLGAGNFSADPLFVDPASGDYHEMGVEGSWHVGGWAPDARNSPCLDAGDPASDWSREPKPCGNRINVGAYGNTAEATRSLPRSGTVLRIY